VVLYVYLYAKSTIPDARARNPNRFFSGLAVETLLPASGNRSNYSHDFFVDAPRSSRYIAYLRYGTIFVLAEQVLLLCGGHQKVINVVGDGMAGYLITPVLVFWTGLLLHWVKFTFETGFELPSSWLNLPCYGLNLNRNILDFMRWPHIDLGAQDLNEIQRPKSFQKNSWK
jgi:hypothetical protein